MSLIAPNSVSRKSMKRRCDGTKDGKYNNFNVCVVYSTQRTYISIGEERSKKYQRVLDYIEYSERNVS